MMMQQFTREVEAFLKRHSMRPSTFGRLIVNDPGFVFRLRKGGECRPSTIEHVRKEMAKKEAEAA
ncbi:MAG: hypothetical protein CMJ32_00125 [Phycisphaerae bacterium]|nr:hypothetical protein [Phycisphaerae bacterium]